MPERLRMTLEQELEAGLAQLGLELSAEQIDRLNQYLALLNKWNKTYNLTAVRETERMVAYHVLDSLCALPHIQGVRVLDVGSGGGMPGMLFAIARPDWQLTLIDANHKKTTFLRQAAIELLLKSTAIDLIMSDDGLQHWALARQLEWIVLDQNRGLGNEKLLPEGYLREPKSRLNRSTVIEHTKIARAQRNMHLEIGQPYLLNPNSSTNTFDAKQYFNAVVGIGFPQRFYQTLNKLGVNQYQAHEFPDHHDYEIADLTFDHHDVIITTEKDAVKFKTLLKQHPEFNIPIWVVPVEAVLSSDCYDLLRQQLQQVGIQFS